MDNYKHQDKSKETLQPQLIAPILFLLTLLICKGVTLRKFFVRIIAETLEVSDNGFEYVISTKKMKIPLWEKPDAGILSFPEGVEPHPLTPGEYKPDRIKKST